MAIETPDWIEGIALVGDDGGTFRLIAVDSDGQLYSVVKGEDGTGTLRLLRVDSDGQLIMVPRGESGNYMLVDANGYLASIIKGEDAGGTLRNVSIDADGQLIMVPRGESGNYMLVDANGYLASIIKGEDAGGTLRNVSIDADGQLIMVPRGESGNYLDVDANGFMSAILKGNDDGSLVTVTVDDAGRLSAFVVDSSDVWDQIVQVGNAELAARLGGLPFYHRTGQVWVIDDFERGLVLWEQDTSGTGANIEVTPSYASHGLYSVGLTGGSDTGQYAQIELTRGLLPPGVLGVSLSFSIPSNVNSLEIRVYYYSGINAYDGRIRLDLVNDDLDYYNDGGGWTKIDDIDIPTGHGSHFNQLKFTVDFANWSYIDLWINNDTYDLSGNFVYSSAYAGSPGYVVIIRCNSRSGNNDTVYVDDFVLTAAE